MNRHDISRLLTKGLKFPGKENRENLKKIGYIKEKTGNVIAQLKVAEENKESVDDESEDEFDISIDGKSDESVDENSGQEEEASTAEDSKPKTKIKSKEVLAQMKHEEINHFRNVKNIHVTGTDIPAPIRKFEDLMTEYNVNEKLVQNLRIENYEEPTPIQMQSWPLLLRRREVLACAPTGSGKTAGFLVPIIHHLKHPRAQGFRAVVLTPTRELAKQIVRESDRLTSGIGLKTSGINKVKGAYKAKYFKKFDILVTTPNRLIFLLEECEELRTILSNVEWLIVDESDRLFEDGKHGFRDQLANIYQACSGPNVIRAMFSATFAVDVEEWCKLNLNDVVAICIGLRNTSCPDVEQELVFCGSDTGKLWALRDIIRKGFEAPVLIFVQTKERARMLFKELILDNLMVACIHSEKTQTQRDNIVNAFRERKIWILICTDLMGRGIDFKGINLVINYDFPPSIVNYIHRVGRTGRAGRKGAAKTFWTLNDKPLLRSIALIMKSSGSEVPDWMLKLKKGSTTERKEYKKMLPRRGLREEGKKLEEMAKERFKHDKQLKQEKREKKNTNNSTHNFKNNNNKKRKGDFSSEQVPNAKKNKPNKEEKVKRNLINRKKNDRKRKKELEKNNKV